MSEPIIPVHKFYDKSKDKRVYDLFIQDSCFESEFSTALPGFQVALFFDLSVAQRCV